MYSSNISLQKCTLLTFILLIGLSAPTTSLLKLCHLSQRYVKDNGEQNKNSSNIVHVRLEAKKGS